MNVWKNVSKNYIHFSKSLTIQISALGGLATKYSSKMSFPWGLAVSLFLGATETKEEQEKISKIQMKIQLRKQAKKS